MREDVELVDGVHGELNANDYLAGEKWPPFSSVGRHQANFGVREMLDTFIRMRAYAAQPRDIRRGSWMSTRINSAVLYSRSTPTWIQNTETEDRLSPGFAAANSNGTKYFHHVRLASDKDVRFSNPYTFTGRDKDVDRRSLSRRRSGLIRYWAISRSGIRLTEGEDFLFHGHPIFLT